MWKEQDAEVPPWVLVSRSVRHVSVQTSTVSLPEKTFFSSGISLCKYHFIPPPTILLPVSLFLPPFTLVLSLLRYQWPSFIPSHRLHAYVPPTTSSLFIPLIFLACIFPRSWLPPLPGSSFLQPSVESYLSSIFGCFIMDLGRCKWRCGLSGHKPYSLLAFTKNEFAVLVCILGLV